VESYPIPSKKSWHLKNETLSVRRLPDPRLFPKKKKKDNKSTRTVIEHKQKSG